MPHDRIADLIGARVPDRSAPVLLYCRSGRRSGLALETLKAGGYTRLTNAGGYDLLARVFGSSR
jgi:phage shock protein E